MVSSAILELHARLNFSLPLMFSLKNTVTITISILISISISISSNIIPQIKILQSKYRIPTT